MFDAHFFAFEIKLFSSVFDAQFLVCPIRDHVKIRTVGYQLARAPTNLFTEHSQLTYPTASRKKLEKTSGILLGFTSQRRLSLSKRLEKLPQTYNIRITRVLEVLKESVKDV